MAKRVGLISINLLAGTAEFNANMDRAKAKVRQLGEESDKAGAHTVSSMQASSAAIRVLEGSMTNNLRAVERFVGTTLRLGPILQAAFPLVGVIAFGGLMVHLGQEVYNFFQRVAEGPRRIANAFREANEPIRLTNDELRIANDRLTNDIAKLEGKRQNNLQLALDDARKSADRLADSLEKDLATLSKLLKEEEIGAFKSFFTGQTATTDVKEYLSGKTGLGGVRGDVSAKNSEYQDQIDEAVASKDRDQEKALITRRDAELSEIYRKAIVHVNSELDKATALQKNYDAVKERRSTGDDNGNRESSGTDQSSRIEELKGSLELLRQSRSSIALQEQNDYLTDKKTQLTQDAANAKLTRPLEEKLAELKASIAETQAKIEATGAEGFERVKLEGHAEAVKAIEQVSKSLKELHQTLSAQGRQEIESLAQEDAYQKELLATGAAFRSSTRETRDRIQAQQLLTEAIGNGYEATKRAREDTAAADFQNAHLGFATPEQLEKIRSSAGELFDAQNAAQSAGATDKLNTQIKLELDLAKAQSQGAEAVRRVTLAYQILDALLNQHATLAQVTAMRAAYDAERANESAAEVKTLNDETAATERLTAARIHGADAVRQAESANQIQKLRDQGESLEVITAAQNRAAAQEADRIAADAAKLATAYTDQLAALEKEIAYLQNIKKTQGDTLGIEIALRNLENERLKLAANQALEGGRAIDGVHAFFLNMQQEAEKTSKIIYDALNKAVDAVSDNLTQLLTGGKTHWADAFKDIGRQMVHDVIKQQLQKGIGALGKKFFGDQLPGVAGIAGKPDGSSEPLALWVRVANAGLPPSLGSQPLPGFGGGFSLPGGTFGGGAQGAGIYSLFGDLGKAFGASASAASAAGDGLTPLVTSSIDFLAGGGDMSADKAYIVGEHGPELVTRSSGTVHSNAATRRLLNQGPNVSYTIDARGTDPVLTERRTRRAIEQTHTSAVATSIRATSERSKRTVQRN